MNVPITDKQYKLDLEAVYHYRNRWSYGLISGVLDFKKRTFIMTDKKKGYCRLKSRENIEEMKDNFKDMVPLTEFLQKRLGYFAGMNTAVVSKTESKYIERMILNVTGCKKMWVSMMSRVN